MVPKQYVLPRNIICFDSKYSMFLQKASDAYKQRVLCPIGKRGVVSSFEPVEEVVLGAQGHGSLFDVA